MLEQILEEIEQEIGRLERARDLLAGTPSTARLRRGKVAVSTSEVRAPRRRRHLSAQARRAIAEAQHRRWAKVRSQKKESSSTSAKQEASAA